MSELKSAGLLEYATVCGETLARGHARSGDPCSIAGYIGASARFDQAIAQFAADYATQTERDWQALLHSRHHAAPSSAKKPATIKSTTKNPTPKSPQPRACAPSPRRS
jgi:hypothetical protein